MNKNDRGEPFIVTDGEYFLGIDPGHGPEMHAEVLVRRHPDGRIVILDSRVIDVFNFFIKKKP